MRKSINNAAKCVNTTNYGLFDRYLFMCDAYERFFTRDNILSSFARTGISPIGPGDTLSVPRPVSKDASSTMNSV